MTVNNRPEKHGSNKYRVLSIDGGGMRGLYSCAYLQGMTDTGKAKYDAELDDFGNKFDLIVGTSTGAILGAGLAAGIPLSGICNLYTECGPKIFPKKLPDQPSKLVFHPRSKLNKSGDAALRKALDSQFNDLTLGQLHQNRQIGLVITSVNCATHRAYVFKTPHDKTSNHRDDDITLVDACLASSAAPIYRSIAVISQEDALLDNSMFIDGGLWANNPVLVALIEALRNTDDDQEIEIFCLGTSPAPTGSVLDQDSPHWGLLKWQFGGRAIEYAMDSQFQVYDDMAGMLLSHIHRDVSITRFPQPVPSADQAPLLALDDASQKAMTLLKQLAARAVDETNQLINTGSEKGKRIAALFGDESEGD
ncbi:MAG: patatin-like phospholipase family protein [Gammaproteobacteria bacterium]|nr:patatin-like phospholipase family protein [Gammaproteobacteria bacterium]